MRRQLWTSLKMVIAMTVLTGVLYPLAFTGVSQVFFARQANGSLVELDGEVVGSALLGQGAADDRFFHPRPSSVDYDPTASSGSNLGPTNPELLGQVEQRVAEYRAVNGLGATEQVPVDAVTASASGLDPHISVSNARLQAGRVAEARGMSLEVVLALIDELTREDAYINVLEINITLEEERP